MTRKFQPWAPVKKWPATLLETTSREQWLEAKEDTGSALERRKETGEWEMVFKEKKSSWKRTGDGVPIFSARRMRKNVR